MKAWVTLASLVLSVAAVAVETPQPFRMADPAKAPKRAFGSTVCMIYQSMCLKAPQHAGSFADFDAGANSSSSRCMARAREFSQWCGNPQGVVTTSTFSHPSRPSLSSSYVATGTSCMISQNLCSLFPDVVGTFQDMAPEVETSVARCLQRAREFSQACANPAGVTTTATFTTLNGQPISNTYFSQGSSCVISQSECRNNPAMAGFFPDFFEGSDVNEYRCARRAEEWARACGNRCHSVTTATFTQPSGYSREYPFVMP